MPEPGMMRQAEIGARYRSTHGLHMPERQVARPEASVRAVRLLLVVLAFLWALFM